MATDEATLEENAEEEVRVIDPQLALDLLDSLPAKNKRYLIPLLQQIQDAYRYVPPEIADIVIDGLGVTRAQMYGVMSFYPQFRTEEPGKYIFKLCFGTACFVKGATIIAEKIKEIYRIGPGETDSKKLFTLQTASCLGNCGAAPMAIVGENTHGTIDPEKTGELLASYANKEDE